MALAAGERRIEALVEQHVEQLGLAWPRDLVLFTVERDDRRGRTLVAVVLLDHDGGERVGLQRFEHLDVDAFCADGLECLLGRRHERSGATDVRVVAGIRGGQACQRRRAGEPLHADKPVHDCEPIRILGGQLAQRWAEDHRVLILVGVDQHDLAAALGERRLADRHDRRDAAARAQQQEVRVQRLGDEGARRREDMEFHAGMCVVAQPVRRVAVGSALDGHRHRVAGERGAAQGIAAGHRAGALTGHAQRQELPGRVPQPIGGDIRTIGHGEHQRPCVGGFLDDVGQLQLEHVATERLIRHDRAPF